MPFSYLTFAAARTLLAARLQDPNLVYWNQPSELYNCLIESVRLFQVLTGAYKQKIAFATQQNISYYDLPTLAVGTNLASIAYTVTDVEVANNVLAALLEPPLVAGWVGTGQFTFAQLQGALQHRLNRFLGDTGCRVAQQYIAGPPPPVEITTLPDGTLDVRRAAWVPVGSASAYPLGRLDEWAEQAYTPDAVQNPAQPENYSVFGVGPAQLRLVPPPLNIGQVDCLLVRAGPMVNLNPAAPVVLQVPDDLSPALKWGVLADLLGTDGPSRDYARAQYCEQRYSEFVQLAAIYPSVLLADIGNITCGLGSVFDMDFYTPDWQQATGAPSFVGMCGRNLACIGQTPDLGPYGIGLWMCANAPITGFMQVGRDQIDPVLDYAQHIASFKMGGAEFDGTARLYQNLIACAKAQNGRLEAVSFYKGQMQQPAAKSELELARMVR
jgi:hypothetical protein